MVQDSWFKVNDSGLRAILVQGSWFKVYGSWFMVSVKSQERINVTNKCNIFGRESLIL